MKRSDDMPPLTEAQKRAKAKYYDGKDKKMLLEVYPSDAELYEKVQEQKNKQGYIKELIRRDILGELPVDPVHQVYEERMKALEQRSYLQGKDNKKDLK